MWEHNHLPGVGPTTEGNPVDLTEKVSVLINELEKAHIYIERLHERLRAKETTLSTFQQKLS